jgi:hypothetical protein
MSMDKQIQKAASVLDKRMHKREVIIGSNKILFRLVPGDATYRAALSREEVEHIYNDGVSYGKRQQADGTVHPNSQ